MLKRTNSILYYNATDLPPSPFNEQHPLIQDFIIGSIAVFLQPADIAQLLQTCRRFHREFDRDVRSFFRQRISHLKKAPPQWIKFRCDSCLERTNCIDGPLPGRCYRCRTRSSTFQFGFLRQPYDAYAMVRILLYCYMKTPSEFPNRYGIQSRIQLWSFTIFYGISTTNGPVVMKASLLMIFPRCSIVFEKSFTQKYGVG